MGTVKNALKKVLPPPVSAFNREVERLLAAQRDSAKLANQLSRQVEALTRQLEVSQQAVQRLEKALNEGQRQNKEKIETVRRQAADASRNAAEAGWADVFHDTIRGSQWLTNTTFSPGRWAVGYPYLYAMYRVLNEFQPKRILELGLGQSTRMIAQYAATHEGVEHIVVEHDPEWIRFFSQNFALPSSTRILQLEREMVPYQEAQQVRVFRGFQEALEGKQFDFISVDAPLGGDMKEYARIDVLRMMPQCLSQDFVVMVDDVERPGEKHTVAAMETCLQEHGIAYQRGGYNGKKDSVLLCSQSVGFLSSM